MTKDISRPRGCCNHDQSKYSLMIYGVAIYCAVYRNGGETIVIGQPVALNTGGMW